MKIARKRISIYQKILFLGALASISAGVLAPVYSQSAKTVLEDSPKQVVDEVWQIVNNEFVDKEFNHTDWQKTREELLSKNYATPQEAYKAIRESLKELNDPYTRFLDPKEFEMLTTQTSGEVSGVGVRLKIDESTKQLTVVEPLEDSPASKAGILAGDKIISINDKPTSLMTLEQASQEIQGEVGSEVTMEISRTGQDNFVVSMTRAQIELPSVSYSIKEEGNIRVGYIKLDEFSSHAAEQMKRAIEKLEEQNVSGFVLDLRGNPGGLLFASVDIARMWMEQGAIVSTVDRKGGDRKFNANGTAITDLPLVVLVNETSASASEILAGALKENGRATIVGTHTYGKATVQSLHPLSDGSGLAVTISRYYPPSGINITKKGILPDVPQELTAQDEFRLRSNPALIATNADPQYVRAIAVLKTNPVGQKKPVNTPPS